VADPEFPQDAFGAALKLRPDFAPARLGQARLAIQRHNSRGALALIGRPLTADPPPSTAG